MKKMDWKRWGKKLAKNSVIVLIAGLAAVYADNPLYLAIAPSLLAIDNAVRHW